MSGALDIAVVGARGFVGQTLVRVLQGLGHRVRAGTRAPHRAQRAQPSLPWTHLDTAGPLDLDVDVAVYLPRTSHQEAEAFAKAVSCRVVALGAPGDPHLDVLPGTKLRTSVIIGEGSEAWTVCRDLATRVPLMLEPPWFAHRTQPLWIGDLIAALVHAIEHGPEGTFDLPGPEALPASAMVHHIAAAKGMHPLVLPLPLQAHHISALWLRMFTRVDATVAERMVRMLSTEHLLEEPGYWAHFEHERVPFAEAARRMLRYEHKPARLPERYLESIVRRVAGGGFTRSEPTPSKD